MKKPLLLLMLGILLFGCIASAAEQKNETKKVGSMAEKTIKKGDIIQVDYIGTFENGTVFDTSIKEEAVKAGFVLRDSYNPLTFTVGDHHVIKGFEDGVLGMKEGQEKVLVVKPSEGYGEFNPSALVKVEKEKLEVSGGANISIGSQLQASNGAMGVVTEISNSSVTIDFNHPLAGKTLLFRVIVKKIN